VTVPRARLRIRCTGAVQGVGFRPTVHRIASELRLTGFVVNDPDGVTIEIEGPETAVARFADHLRSGLPPLARLDGFEVDAVAPQGSSEFVVVASREGPRAKALVPPDAALCRDCRREMLDRADRRYRYPFTTCTNCGPRFTLVHHLPYDRDKTSMACFPLCDECHREYTDPADRRFHAEPVCCPRCGPRLWLATTDGTVIGEHGDALAAARIALAEGKILAVKGLGGFQLACRADRDEPVAELRRRKRRPAKPFAVMVGSLDEARTLSELTPQDEGLMESPRSPIVLAPRIAHAPLSDRVAPGIEDVGVLLPTTPLHVELFAGLEPAALIMTSANLSEEPICRSNREAIERLADIADLFLLNDRDVVRRTDDSVVRSTPIGPLTVRRARGWVPEPLPLPVSALEPILATGGHLQVTACVAMDDQAFPSQHVGDLDSEAARRFHREVIAGLEDFLEITPTTIVADAHPDYPSTWLARELVKERCGRLVGVQHHLAHAAAVLAENGRFPAPGERALAISLDGTGWGPDGTAWGGEWLGLDGDLRWQRLAHLEPLPLVGGERAVREPWRVAAAALAVAGIEDLVERIPLGDMIPREHLAETARLASAGTWPLASGAGRLFEAFGAVLGLTVSNDWEGEAAVRLETVASTAAASDTPTVWPEVQISHDGLLPRLPSVDLIAAGVRRLADKEPIRQVAASFHATFCVLAAELTCRVAPDEVDAVALGGGCMVNRLLIAGLDRSLGSAGYEPLFAVNVPPGDGGLSYGQAVLAAASATLKVEIAQTGESLR
jgi:hydrogenase maturation protein HypF